MKFSVYSGTYYIEGHNTYMLPWSKVPFSASLLDFTRGSPNGRVSHMFAPGRQNAWRLFQIICPLFKIPSDFACIHYSLSYSLVSSFLLLFVFYFIFGNTFSKSSCLNWILLQLIQTTYFFVLCIPFWSDHTVGAYKVFISTSSLPVNTLLLSSQLLI